MNYGIIIKMLGRLLILESFFLLPPSLIAFFEKSNDLNAFLTSLFLALSLGLFMARFHKKTNNSNINIKEGLAIVAYGWVLLSLVGALPLFLSGEANYIDSFFETVSGFTTTGATILSDVEVLSKSLLFWRSFTHWIGGMGILVFTVSLLPALGVGGFQIFKAESPGPITGKIAPKIKDTAKILYTIYFTITIVQVILLCFAGMSFFDSLIYTFGTVGTGGLATKNLSVGFYENNYIQLIIAFFMVFSGVNFSLYYMSIKGKFKEAIKDEEMKLYFFIIFTATILITINLFKNNYSSLANSLKDAFFQVGSIITTTGYSTADFNLWPTFSKAILLSLMFIGGSAGSTAGGIKVIRLLVMIKLIKREILQIFHPKAIKPIKINGKIMEEDIIEGINAYMYLYLIIFILSTILISLENIDLLTAISSVASSLGNIGPGLNLTGPSSNFGFYSPLAKLYFSFLMLLGRLELFTIIALISPINWSKSN